MTVQINHHIVITDEEQNMIVNALAFYNDYHATDLLSDDDSQEQWRIAFREDNRGSGHDGPVDQLATKIATSN